MKKKKRHDLIKKMIKEEKLGTQKDIQTRLEEEGIYVTQTTLSRDLREIGLIKVKKNGQLYYVLAQETARIDLTEVLSYHLRGVAVRNLPWFCIHAWEKLQCWLTSLMKIGMRGF